MNLNHIYSIEVFMIVFNYLQYFFLSTISTLLFSFSIIFRICYSNVNYKDFQLTMISFFY